MPVFGPAQKAKLSLDAAHMVSRLEANRDHLRISAAVFGSGVLYAAHALSNDLGNMATGASLVLIGSAGYAAMKAYEYGRKLDSKVEQLACATEQAMPSRDKLGLLDVGQASLTVAKAAAVVPDLVKSLAERRERVWEKALDPDYRPAPRRPGAG